MPGVPGQRSGPPPKRSEFRRRQNADPFGGITRAPAGENVTILEPDPSWHPLARYFYEAAQESGEVQFYESSDYAVLYLVCENLSRELKPTILVDKDGAVVLDDNGKPVTRTLPIRGASLSAYLKAFQSLLLTEGDRRRLRVELERRKQEQAEDNDRPATVIDFASRLGGN